MQEIEIFKSPCRQALLYQEFLKRKFFQVEDLQFPVDLHLVLKNKGAWCAGASLKHWEFLRDDPAVNELWEVQSIRHCTRILRLWSDHPLLLPHLLEAIFANLPKASFVYGILSLSAQFATAHSAEFKIQPLIAKPRFALQDAAFDNETPATSEGQKLIRIYQSLNAQFLGPVAVSPNDQRVRALMGTAAQEIALKKLRGRYAHAY